MKVANKIENKMNNNNVKTTVKKNKLIKANKNSNTVTENRKDMNLKRKSGKMLSEEKPVLNKKRNKKTNEVGNNNGIVKSKQPKTKNNADLSLKETSQKKANISKNKKSNGTQKMKGNSGKRKLEESGDNEILSKKRRKSKKEQSANSGKFNDLKSYTKALYSQGLSKPEVTIKLAEKERAFHNEMLMQLFETFLDKCEYSNKNELIPSLKKKIKEIESKFGPQNNKTTNESKVTGEISNEDESEAEGEGIGETSNESEDEGDDIGETSNEDESEDEDIGKTCNEEDGESIGETSNEEESEDDEGIGKASKEGEGIPETSNEDEGEGIGETSNEDEDESDGKSETSNEDDEDEGSNEDEDESDGKSETSNDEDEEPVSGSNGENSKNLRGRSSQIGGGSGNRSFSSNRDNSNMDCHNCHERGHMSFNCQNLCSFCPDNNDKHKRKDCPKKNLRGRSSQIGGGSGNRSFSSNRDNSNMDCHNCHERGHMSFNCQNLCSFCPDNNDKHKRKDCPKGRSKGNCFNCNKSGHISRDCPESGKETGRSKGNCFKCNRSGHISRDCPENGKETGR